MDRSRYRKITLRAVAGVGLLLTLVTLLFVIEQRRTQAEMGTILSALFSDEVLHYAQDLEAGRQIQIVVQRDSKNPWEKSELQGSLLFDRRRLFVQSSRTTRVSFFVSNVFSTDIQTELHLPGGVQPFFLSRKELERTKPSDFQTRFPNNLGYFVVSHVGLNLGESEALLYIDHFCNGLCGGGVYVLMHKVNGTWHVFDQHGTWVS